jgi:glucose-1-phosphate thymidylyltransferase
MKGVILAGGTGSRMLPLTKVTNKHLLPVYNEPMIYYPLKTLANAGINDIIIISGQGNAGHFLDLLGSGKEFGVKLSYGIQEKAGGIAQALMVARKFVGKDKCVVVLGDNIFEDNIIHYVNQFKQQKKGARIFLKQVNMNSAKRFGIATVKGNKVTYVEEKPEHPKSKLAMTGLYMFDSDVFSIIKDLKPSKRGELEITDAIDAYLKKDILYFNMIQGFWSDAGTFESNFKATEWVRKKRGEECDRTNK